MKYDIIIIGAGLGGLTAGARLAKEGKKVLLVEQHDRPGGCATTFKRKDFTMEVGLHEMDGLHPRDMKNRLFDELGISGKVEFLEVPEFYRFKNDRYDLVIPHQPEKVKEVLMEYFPDEAEGINKYFDTLLNARRVIAASRNVPDKSVGEWLDEIFANEDIKLILLGNLGYFHDDPYSLSFYYYINAQGAYYGGRANYIKGGSQVLSNAFVSIIEDNDGTVLLNHLVTSVEFYRDQARGIIYSNLKDTEALQHKAEADIIIVNSSLPDLAERLLPEEFAFSLMESIKDIDIGASLLTVYFGFNKPLKELGNKNYSVFIFDDSVKSQKDILQNNHDYFSSRSFTFVDYSQVDSGLAPDGKSVGAVCCIDYPEDWEGLSKEQYQEKKTDVARIITSRLEKIIPGFTEAVEYVEVGTSMTVKRYTLNPGGAVYGFAQKPGKSMDYLSKLPENIYLASAWGKFGGGFSGAIFSGYMTAMDIIRKTRSE